jgi:hypothetical protein
MSEGPNPEHASGPEPRPGQPDFQQPAYGGTEYGQPPPSGQPPPYGAPPPYGDPPTYGQPPAGPDGYPAPGSYPSPEPPPAHPGWSGLAIAGFIVSFIPVVGLFVGLPLAIAGVVATKPGRKRGRGLAIAGIVIAVVFTGLVVAGLVYNVVSKADRDPAGHIIHAGRLDYGEIRAGDCLAIDQGSLQNRRINPYTDIKGVPCASSHNSQALSLVTVGSGSYDLAKILPAARSCQREVQRRTSSAGSFLPYPIYPSRSLWHGGSPNHVICLAVRPDFGDFANDFSR